MGLTCLVKLVISGLTLNGLMCQAGQPVLLALVKIEKFIFFKTIFASKFAETTVNALKHI
jgi:hypothetical protein